MPWLRESPSYYRFYDGTIRLEETSQGKISGEKLNTETGLFEPASFDEIYSVLGGSRDSDFSRLSEESFIKETEELRNYYLRGEGLIFDIYRKIDGIFRALKAEGRQLTSEEKREISSLRRQTFQLWEEESERLAAGEPATFQYTSAVGGS